MDSTARIPAVLGDFWTHLRLPFQAALAPFFLIGLVDAGADLRRDVVKLLVAFIAVHVGLYGGTTVYNSYYDRDEGPIGMLKRPPPLSHWMRDLCIAMQVVAVGALATIDGRAGVLGAGLALLGAAYSHPRIRLKAMTLGGLLTVAFGQGAIGFGLGRTVGSPSALDAAGWSLAGAAALITVGLYPLTQVYQIDEDRRRGDVTLPVRYGWRASFVFSAVTTTLGLVWLTALLVPRFTTIPWPLTAAAASIALAIYLWTWARRFEGLGVYGNHDRAMALTMAVAFPLAAVLLAALLIWPGAARAEESVQATFEFHDPTTDEPLLKGKETEARDGRMTVLTTEYVTLKGDVAQTEACRFDHETLALESYVFNDLVTGELAELTVKDGVASARYRSDKDAALKTDEFKWTATSLSGKALPALIEKHLVQIQAGEAVTLDLYVPFRLETIGFRAVKDAAKSVEGQLVVRVEPSNWLIRQVAPAIAFTFALGGANAPTLTRYDGPSVVDIAGEKNRKVRIHFR